MTSLAQQSSLGLQWIIRIGLAAALVVPLVVHSQFFFPFIVPKNIAFRFLVEAVFFAYLALVLIDSRFKPRSDLLTKILIGFIGAMFLSAIFGLNFPKSFWGNFERMSGLLHWLHLLAYFFVLLQTQRSLRDWHRLFTFSVLVSVLMSAIAWAQHFNLSFILESSGGSRLAGTVGNPTFLAAYLLFHLFFLMYFWAKPRRFHLSLFAVGVLVFDVYLAVGELLAKFFSASEWGFWEFMKFDLLSNIAASPLALYPLLVLQASVFGVWAWQRFGHASERAQIVFPRCLLGLIFMFELFIFYQTQTRGTLLGFWGSMLALTVVAGFFLPVSRSWRQISRVGLVISILLPILLFAARDAVWLKSFPTLNRVATISLTDITTESRLLTWKASARGWVDSAQTFLIGVGPENYADVFSKRFPPRIYLDPGSQVWFDRAHNIFFDVALTTGLLGLLLFLSIFAIASRNFIRRWREDGVSGSWLWVGLLLAYLFQNLFVFDTVNTEILLLLVLAFAAFQSFRQQTPAPEREPLIAPYWTISAALVLLFITNFVFNAPIVRANQQLYQALVLKSQPQSATTNSLELFEDSLTSAVTGRYETREQLATYAAGLVRATGGAEGFIGDIFSTAALQLERSLEEEPWNVRHQLWIGDLYASRGRLNAEYARRARTAYTRAIELSPTRPQLYFRRGEMELLLGDAEAAIADFSTGLDLAPWVIDSRFRMFALQAIIGNDERASQELAAIRDLQNGELSPNDYARALNVYSQTRRYDKMLELYDQLINLEPRVGSHYLGAAEVLARLGRASEARSLIQLGVDADSGITQAAEELENRITAGEFN